VSWRSRPSLFPAPVCATPLHHASRAANFLANSGSRFSGSEWPVTGIALVARRVVRAEPARVFEAWTQPGQLRAWWGPRPVTCSDAEVDLRVRGAYRIVNLLPNGNTVAISGEFRVVESPHKLVYTWRIDDAPGETSLVTVRFEARGRDTEIVVVHQEIPSETLRQSHEKGWSGCLDGLERYFP
jgi:uncharacterized protein YndB with AHSA1/START domain